MIQYTIIVKNMAQLIHIELGFCSQRFLGIVIIGYTGDQYGPDHPIGSSLKGISEGLCSFSDPSFVRRMWMWVLKQGPEIGWF